MIHFYDDLFIKTLECIKEAKDCADTLNDLNRIEQAKANVYFDGGLLTADQLDRELRMKYPIIDKMLDIANAMRMNSPLSPAPRTGQTRSAEDIAISNLEQDRCGIICQVALKKEIVQNIKEIIRIVD